VLVAGANAIAPPPHGVGRAAARRRFRPVVEIHRAAEDGATASGSGSVTVTSAAGTCPPP
jgi:hypothetical protein